MRARLALMISSSLPSTSRQNTKSHNTLVGATDVGLPAPSVITLTIIIKIMINDDSNNSFNRNQLNSKQESEATATLTEYVFQLVDGWQNEHGKHAFLSVWHSDDTFFACRFRGAGTLLGMHVAC